jgi:hypothetical protein
VHTSSSTWAFELEQLAPDIRRRLGALAPKKLRFAPGPLPEPETPAVDGAAVEVLQPSAEDLDAAAALAAEIDDEKLRKLVARAAAASLAKARSGRSF